MIVNLPLDETRLSVILPNLPGCGGSAANADTNAKHPGPENVYLCWEKPTH